MQQRDEDAAPGGAKGVADGNRSALILEGSQSMGRLTAIACAAKASLISRRSSSWCLHPVLAWLADTGPMPMIWGFSPVELSVRELSSDRVTLTLPLRARQQTSLPNRGRARSRAAAPYSRRPAKFALGDRPNSTDLRRDYCS